MIERLKTIFRSEGGTTSHSKLARELAVAALLIEAAYLDQNFDETERQKVIDLIGSRFAIEKNEIGTLIQEAEAQVQKSVDFYFYAREIKSHFSHDDCLGIMEMLWEVILADGKVHDHEASLARRVAGLLYVTDRENGEARKRAKAKLKS